MAKWLLYLGGTLDKSVPNSLVGEGKEIVYLPILLHGGSN